MGEGDREKDREREGEGEKSVCESDTKLSDRGTQRERNSRQTHCD